MKISPLVAEFIGTFALILIGVGSVVAVKGGDLVAIALAHGLTIAVMGTALGAISGGHFNPAVSLALTVAGKMKPAEMVAYWAAQFAGGAAGSAALVAILVSGNLEAVKHGVPAINTAMTTAAGGFILEVIMTFFLVLAVFMTAVDRRAPKMGALFIGLVIVCDIFIGGPVTGACMNPARYFGPALAGGGFGEAGIYLGATFLGAIIAALIYKGLFEEKNLETA